MFFEELGMSSSS